MKKIVAIVLALMLLIPALSFAEIKQATVEEVLPLMSEAKKLCEPGEVTLKIMAVVNSAVDTWKDMTVMKAYEQITGVHVEFVEIDGTDIDQNIRLTVMSMKDDPDAVDVIMFTMPGTDMLMDYGEDGTLLALNDLIKENAPNAQAMLDNVEGLKSMVTAPDGNIYSMWRLWDNPNETIMNKQFVFLPWLAQYTEATGKGMPDNLDEYLDMLRYFRDNDMNGNGDATDEIPVLGNNQTTTEGGSTSAYIISAFELWNCKDYYHITDEGEVIFEAATEQYRDALKFMRAMNEEGLYPEEDFTLTLGDYRNTTNAANPEDIIVGVGSAPYYMRFITQSIYSRCYDDFEAIPPLRNYYDPEVRQTAQRAKNLPVLACCINANCKNPDIAVAWLDYWLTEQGTHLNTLYGLEGRDWEWDDTTPNLAGTTPSINIKQTLENSGNRDCPGHTGVPNYMTKEMFLQTAATKSGRTYPDYLAHMIYEPYAVYTNIPFISWCGDYDIGTEYGELNTQINDFVRTSLASFVLGKPGFDPNNDGDWQNYLNQLNGLGLERYIQIVPDYLGIR